ncbi:MAG: hypothetical protein LKG79_11815 [Furfurilactobacillus sp.]|jgi:hypothetical protein|uniref:Uncharacterized protein n=2 Tax=Furfurilactobacillus TaxID=2767882 RepID=A0ABT6DAB8_9LACO|nr:MULTISPECIES: hypothetical protein [Furfurilactobacillus]QLE65405.1 hypothetical protein LROSL2_0052 [Furfurilactobacillus rossiae]MCF6160903.1 hypothetical protein [Furfurilactobacillus milii]MCF6163331.1 hypothetical protein [Furfurilactobacillus milii]MCH4011923.1 hypothetical protein [Furfurilactobacillus sp.]MCH4037815.1 hypothetical protein [Furfurilactobacillus sp.]
MVKQGKYAGSSRQKQLRNLRQRISNKGQHTINETDLVDFLLVRWHLTQHNQTQLVEQTTEHFLRTWIEQAQHEKNQVWNLATITVNTLKVFAIQVPWQFYAIINHEWSHLQRFLVKEVPAVPLKDQLLTDNQMSTNDWQTALSTQLTVNSFLLMFQGNQQQLSRVSDQQIEQLRSSFLTENSLNWQAVATVFQPLKYTIPADADEDSVQWLTELDVLTPNALQK